MIEMDAYCIDLGVMPYLPAFEIQEDILSARMLGFVPDTIILQETPRTFTIGRSGSRSNILLSSLELLQEGIEVLEVNRGGDVTYHGPGQLIVSPLLYLGNVNKNANQYMHALEEILIKALAEFDIRAHSLPDYPGVWVNKAKIAAVGIAVRHGYTFHGFSLNINLDLLPFEYINPCGVVAMPVTSMQVELGENIPAHLVKRVLLHFLEQEFTLKLQDRLLSDIKSEINFQRAKRS